jgi:hypothetical protein
MTGQQQLVFENALSRGLRGWLIERHTTGLIRHARRASESWWSQTYRWQVMPITGFVVALVGVVFYSYCLLMTWGVGKDNLIMLVALFSLCPVGAIVMSSGGLKFRWFPHELMMPVSRKAYLRQQGTAAAIAQFQVWIAMSAASILWILTAAKEPRPVLLADAMAFSALSQIWLFGLTVWIIRFRSRVLSIVGLFIGLYSTMMPMMMLDAPVPLDQWRLILPSIGVLLAILGLLLTWRAYRRWLVTDID